MDNMLQNILNSNKKIYLYAKDKNSKYLFCNEAVAEMADLDSPKKIIGKTDHDFIWRDQANIFISQDIDTLNGKSVVNEQEKQTFPSHIATVLITKTILKNKNDEACGVAGQTVDITGFTLKKKNGEIDTQKNTFLLGENFYNEYLTRRELEVFRYLLAGKSVEEIAFELMRSPKTVQSQIKSIANKLQCSHKSEIVPAAIQYGLTHVLDDIVLEKIDTNQ